MCRRPGDLSSRVLAFPMHILSGGRAERSAREGVMLRLAVVFLLVGIVAALLGFTSIAGASFAIAKIFAFLFLVLFLVFLLIGMSVARRV
ncbi:MAG TPA: DUF1328 domain-containing protein [Thermoanaerobaculia bacterium]|nr:DUF1328 domain-containing protein [Thermoanaerobaculia bacterium]